MINFNHFIFFFVYSVFLLLLSYKNIIIYNIYKTYVDRIHNNERYNANPCSDLISYELTILSTVCLVHPIPLNTGATEVSRIAF